MDIETGVPTGSPADAEGPGAGGDPRVTETPHAGEASRRPQEGHSSPDSVPTANVGARAASDPPTSETKDTAGVGKPAASGTPSQQPDSRCGVPSPVVGLPEGRASAADREGTAAPKARKGPSPRPVVPASPAASPRNVSATPPARPRKGALTLPGLSPAAPPPAPEDFQVPHFEDPIDFNDSGMGDTTVRCEPVCERAV